MSKKRVISNVSNNTLLKKVKEDYNYLKQELPIEIYNKVLSLPNNNNWRISDAIEHLMKVDNKFKTLIINHGIPSFYEKSPLEISKNNYFHELMKIIVYQQLAGNIADQIFNRLLLALKIKQNDYCKPEAILSATIDLDIRDGKRKVLVNSCESGLSLAKANYLKSLAEHFSDRNCLKDVDLSTLDDETLVNKLVAVKGLGIWSVHMFMIFTLRRPNVLAIGDLGIRQGLSYFLGKPKDSFEGTKKQEEIISLCSHWQPYSSLACALMWKITDSKKTIKTK